MANTPNGFVADRSGWNTPNQAKPLNPSKVDVFVQQQRDPAANTRVGKVEASVGQKLGEKIQQVIPIKMVNKLSYINTYYSDWRSSVQT